jgi:hypothetical protein
MSGNKEYSVTGLLRARISADARAIEIKVAVVGDQPLILTTSPNTLSQVVTGLTELETAVQSQMGSTTGHFAIQAGDAQELRAKEAAGGDRILLSIRNSKGRFLSFALTLGQAQRLRADLKKAEAKAKELASKSRN